MSEAYSDLGATPPSTYSAQRTRKSPDPKIVKIISELGLRYRPLATADQEAHAAQVALLCKDLETVEPAALSAAAQEYARTERFMPKACDLLAIVNRRKSDISPDGPDNLARLAHKYNNSDWMPKRLEWSVRGTELKLGPRHG